MTYPEYIALGAEKPGPPLTKREHFAAMAMQGLLASGECRDKGTHTIAADALTIADGLIHALSR